MTETDTLDAINEVNALSDGKGWFCRINSVIDHAFMIQGSPDNKVAQAVFSRCLANPTKHGIEPSWDTITGELKVNGFTTGRWSPPISVIEIAQMIYTKNEMYDSFGPSPNDRIVKKWIDSKIGTALNSLEKGRAIFRFKIKVGKIVVGIATYNRYLVSVGYLWPETLAGRKKGKDYKGKDYVHQLPVVPQHLASLTNPHNLMVVFRMKNKLYQRLHHLPGWSTMEEVEARILHEYCSNFLQGLIKETVPEVRKHFPAFEAANMTPIDYIKEVNRIARSLPPFAGLNLTLDRIKSLNVPFRITLQIEDICRRHTSVKHNAIIEDVDAVAASLTNDDEDAVAAYTVGGENAVAACTVYGEDAVAASSEEVKTAVNSLNKNELAKTAQPLYRSMSIKTNEVVEPTGGTSMEFQYKTGTETIPAEVISETDESYNGDMKDSLIDRSLTPEKMGLDAFTYPLFTPENDPSLRLHRDRKPKEVKVKTEEDLRREVEQRLQSEGKKLAKEQDAVPTVKTILNDTHMFVRTYCRIYKEHNPTVQLSTAKEHQIHNLGAVKSAWDKLLQRGTSDKDVLESWMHFTAEANKKRGGYPTVTQMLKTWAAFDKQMISAAVVATKVVTKAAVKEALKRDTIGESMKSHFSVGFTPKVTFEVCRNWGIVLTAQYLASKMSKGEAVGLVEASLIGQTHLDLSEAFSATVKFEAETAGMLLSDWRVKLSDLVTKAGKLPVYPVKGHEKEWCERFISGLSRRS